MKLATIILSLSAENRSDAAALKDATLRVFEQREWVQDKRYTA